MSDSRIAVRFIINAVQDWGQPESERISAVQDVLNAAGFKATASCSPVFGGIWPLPCTGPEGEPATAWLKSITKTMKRGKFEDELAHVEKFIADAQQQKTKP